MAYWSPGDVVLTTYGVGVVVSCPSSDSHDHEGVKDQHYDVRLWRVPGKSIGSAASAHLKADSLIEKLPASPGMTTLRKMGSGEVQAVEVRAYLTSSHSFLIIPSSMPTQLIEVDSDQLQAAPSAKFYPLLAELMRRGDQAAHATTAFLTDEKVAKVVETSAKLMEEKSTEASQASSEEVDKIASKVTQSLPKAEDMKEVYNMLKDEELTVLLKKGQERLQELMSTDVSKATKDALQKTGIIIADGEDNRSSFSETISKSRDAALSALESLLKDADVDPKDLAKFREKLEGDFTQMFDSLSEAAKSDRTLGAIFDTISGKTAAWQEATGRLMSTKSGSLFMEGASRLEARAREIFSNTQLDWAGQVGSKLTKAFTEGDAAVARLKSIEMGDAVRSRLVTAIEIRSGSQGGLDGIIAGALTTISSSGKDGGSKLQALVNKLQTDASGATKDARETLISVLSHQSEYQDVAMLQLESVLCELDKHLGEEMTPAEIAAIARGEGGTAAIFDPIAKRASKEISTYLDQAESSVSDPGILSALQHVRRIISGELTMSSLMDEVVTILNDESVLSTGENLMKHGEFALDAIEGMSGKKIAGDVMVIVEKAGITKEAVMSHIEALNVNELLDTAGNAVTDEKARKELISSATDTALDFVLRILPSMPVPPLDGVKEGLVYHLSNLSMEGFKVKKENIMVEIAGMRATKHLKMEPSLSSGDPGWASSSDQLMAQEARRDSQLLSSADSSFDVGPVDSEKVIKATELLIIDVRRISAILDGVVWSFEQTYMPYLKGNGKANVKMSGGSIRLQFELRKRKKTTDPNKNGSTWEPVLCLHDRACAIEQVDLVLQGESRLTWIFNKLASLFKGVLRDYVVKTILNILMSKSGYILEQLNTNLAPYWGLILKTASLSMDDLVEADRSVIMASLPDEDEGMVELVWRANLPLGMNLLLNDDSGKLKVVDFPRGSQARAVCTEKEINPDIFNGATIVAVNGFRYDFQEDLFDALKNPSRPKSILFELANHDDAARVQKFVEGSSASNRKTYKVDTKEQEESKQRELKVRDVVFEDGMEIGLEFVASPDDYSLSVKDFIEGESGIVLAAERTGLICVGDILTHVNGKLVLGESGKGRILALQLLETEGNSRPLTLTFTEPYVIQKVFERPREGTADLGGPMEFKLKEENKRIIVEDFDNVNGTVESSGVLIGDHLIFINGQPVGAGCALMGEHQPPELSEIYETLREPSIYPAALTFARPKHLGNRWTSTNQKFSAEDAETTSVTANSFEQIGCVFESLRNLDIVVSDLFAVPGPIQVAMRPTVEHNGQLNLSIEAINGQFVPSYASTSIVMNAMKRSWSTNGKVEILFCDDERKSWIHRLE